LYPQSCGLKRLPAAYPLRQAGRERSPVKNSTAFKQAKSSVRFLSVVVPCLWGLVIWSRHWGAFVHACLFTFGLAGDLWVLRRTKKGLAADPDFLKKKVPWT